MGELGLAGKKAGRINAQIERESWRLLARFLAEHPWHVVFGIGYKLVA